MQTSSEAINLTISRLNWHPKPTQGIIIHINRLDHPFKAAPRGQIKHEVVKFNPINQAAKHQRLVNKI